MPSSRDERCVRRQIELLQQRSRLGKLCVCVRAVCAVCGGAPSLFSPTPKIQIMITYRGSSSFQHLDQTSVGSRSYQIAHNVKGAVNAWQQVTADSGRACDTTAANINKYPGYDGPHVTSGNLVSKKDQ